MKKMYMYFALAVAFCVTAFRPIAEPFEGTIRYETSTTGEAPQLLKEKLAKYYELSFKGPDLKIRGDAPLKGEILLKKKLGKLYILRTDQKNAYEVDLKDERIPQNALTPIVTRLKETMTIAGYVCQKYQIQYNDDLKLYVWTTNAIQVDQWNAGQIFGGQFKLPAGVDGFPLKIQLVSSSFTVTGSATVVKIMPMADAQFSIPNGMVTKKL